MSRHKDAIFIQQGACNLAAISRTLTKAIDEARSENIQPSEDEAVRLILHQMCFLSNIRELDDHLSEYERCLEVCEKLSTE